MPVWLIALQTIIPLIKWGVDTLLKHPPAPDAPQANKDAHAMAVETLTAAHTCLNGICEAHK